MDTAAHVPQLHMLHCMQHEISAECSATPMLWWDDCGLAIDPPNKSMLCLYSLQTLSSIMYLSRETQLSWRGIQRPNARCATSFPPPWLAAAELDLPWEVKGGKDAYRIVSASQGPTAEPGRLLCSCYRSTSTTDLTWKPKTGTWLTRRVLTLRAQPRRGPARAGGPPSSGCAPRSCPRRSHCRC